jgi:hypothetical protein
VIVSVDVREVPLVRSPQVSHMITVTVDVVTLTLATPDGEVVGRSEISAAGHDQRGPSIATEARVGADADG